MSTSPPQPVADVSRFLRGMWRLNRALAQQLEPLLEEKHGLDARTFFILKTIHGGAAYPKALAATLKIPSTLLSRYLDALNKKGYLERHIDEHDSRRTRLTLTPEGERVMRETDETLHEVVSAKLATLDPATLSALLDALDLLTAEGHPA